MRFYFFDTSALVKRYHHEKGTENVDRIFAVKDRVIVVSNLSIVEAISAFKRKQDNSEITKHDVELLASRLFSDILKDFLVLELNETHIQRSVILVLKEGLRTLDALQLAVSSDLKELNPVFVCADKNLCKTAKKSGMETINPEEK
jgi:predicted nucleic acid-binding protein